MVSVLVVAGVMLCAIQCVRAQHLLSCTLWLAGASALLSIMLAELGAAEVAVIELSVGAGLVTVLFVFAVGIAGESGQALSSLVPKPLAWALVILVSAVFVWLIWLVPAGISTAEESSLAVVMWEQRKLDVWMQLVFLFSGVLGVLGLLVEANLPLLHHMSQVERKPDASELEPVVPLPLHPITHLKEEQR